MVVSYKYKRYMREQLSYYLTMMTYKFELANLKKTKINN